MDGTTHTAAEQARIDTELIIRLRRLPGHDEGVRLLNAKLFTAAEDVFRKREQRIGAAVALYLAGKVEASARELLALPPSEALTPFLGETAGDAPALKHSITRHLLRIAEAHPRNAEAQYYYGKVAQDAAALRRACEGDNRAFLELGRLYTERGRKREAVEALEEALRRDPSLKTAHFRLAGLYRALGDAAKSREHMAAFQRAQ